MILSNDTYVNKQVISTNKIRDNQTALLSWNMNVDKTYEKKSKTKWIDKRNKKSKAKLYQMKHGQI